ncbi:MAG: hypothetical protein H9533_19945 [Rhodobacteraceae bacterium]|nr:hypothetical protein [Paracoccaceae bacterium]
MSRSGRKLLRFLGEFGAVMALVGTLTVVILLGLAALFPLPPGSLSSDLRHGAGMAVATAIGLRISRWMERRWGED